MEDIIGFGPWAAVIAILVIASGISKKNKEELINIGKIIGLIVLAAILFPAFVEVFNVIITGSEKINPSLPGILLHFCWAFSAIVLYVRLKKVLTGILGIIADGLIIAIIGSIASLYILGLGDKRMNIWLANVFVFALVCVATYHLSKDWKAKGRSAFAVPITYVICVAFTSLLFWLIGFRHGLFLFNSFHFCVGVLGLQVLFFWLCFGLDAEVPDMTKRWSYRIIKPWLILVTFGFIYVLYPMLSGKEDPEKFFVYGEMNKSNVQAYQLGKDMITSQMEALIEEREAIMNSNKPTVKKQAEVQRIAAQIKVVGKNLKEYEADRPVALLPESVDDGSGLISTGIKTAIKSGKAAYSEGKAIINEQFPPTQSKPDSTGNTFTFVGIGYTGGEDGQGGMEVLTVNKDVHQGQTVKVSGNAETLFDWQYQKISSFKNKTNQDGTIRMRAPQGELVTINIK